MRKFKRLAAAVAAMTMVFGSVNHTVFAAGAELKGDADVNGEVSLSDVIVVSKYNLNNSVYPLANDTAFANADMNGDGEVNGLDTSSLIENQLGKEYIEPVQSEKTVELTAGLQPYSIQASKPSEKFENSQIDFAVSFLKNSMKTDGNTLVSPYSAAQALAMAANGADGKTLDEIMKVIGGGMDLSSFNDSMAAFNNNLYNGEGCKLLTANSIWYKNNSSFSVDKDFLLANKSVYDAQVFAAPMDQGTVKDINSWVSEHTDKMIPEMVKELDPRVVMSLINAVTFDAEWDYQFSDNEKANVKEFFNSFDGKKQDADVLSKTTDACSYMEDDEATGFIKNYKGYKYAFAAILPNEDIPIDKYVEGLTAEKLSSLIDSASGARVSVKIPEFTVDYDNDLNDVLKAMGIKEAFKENDADFTKLGRSPLGNIYLGKALQKTHIEVNASGTKAAAATDLECMLCCAKEIKKVHLNRPFVYAIIDKETKDPIFMGTLMTLD